MGGLGWRVMRSECDYEVQPELGLSPAEAALAGEMAGAHAAEAGCQTLEERLARHCMQHGILLERSRAEAMISMVRTSLDGFGPFQQLLADDDIEEIAAVGPGKPVYVYGRGRGWLKTNVVIDDAQYAADLVNKMARPLGRRISSQVPRLNAVLPDSTRLHATIAPIAHEGFEITLRKFRRKPFSIPELVANGTMSSMAAAFLWAHLQGDCSAVVAGNAGSGKTTTINALFSFVPASERIVAIEETPEIWLPHGHFIRLVASGELGAPLGELVKDTLRMRPDRVIVGEITDTQEAGAFFDTLLCGQSHGTFATMHANSSQEALARLRSLGGGAGELDAISFIVIQRREFAFDEAGRRLERRLVTEISKVAAGSPVKLFTLGKTGGLAPTPALAGHFKAARTAFSDLPLAVSNMQSVIEGLRLRNAGFDESLREFSVAKVA